MHSSQSHQHAESGPVVDEVAVGVNGVGLGEVLGEQVHDGLHLGLVLVGIVSDAVHLCRSFRCWPSRRSAICLGSARTIQRSVI